MAAPLANISVDRRCAALCPRYAKTRVDRRSRRRREAPRAREKPSAGAAQSMPAREAFTRAERVDRAVLRVLLHDHARDRLPMTAIPKTFATIQLEDVADAISRLEDEGLVEIRSNHLELSSCARRMAELGLLTA